MLDSSGNKAMMQHQGLVQDGRRKVTTCQRQGGQGGQGGQGRQGGQGGQGGDFSWSLICATLH
ncbi:MAG TPA: hypothetical protein DCY91_26500 [Cyanobacteria bacterium UBA11370]|nr:hypothetical protein [Cyanobacteria bacterium UBA11370]HBY80419.1 hypothetical protein [Cyanobacteria bacterium UBA11148]